MPFPLLLILGALTAFGPLAIDFYLPSFPAIASSFASDVEHVQLSLASYFAGLTLGQLIYGPLADRFGRRLPVLAGVGIFLVASLICALAPSLEWLIAARFLQALGGCAGMVMGRAMVRDLCEPKDAAKAFSQLMLVMGIAPILAPVGGGLLLEFGGWRAIFHCLALFAAIVGVAVFLRLPETLPLENRQPLKGITRRYLRLLGDREFMLYALSGGIALAGMFAYIAGSPFVFIQLYGVPAKYYGWLFGLNAAGFILVAQINARLMRIAGPAFWLRRFIWVYALSATLLLILALVRPAHLWVLMVPLFICISSLGCIAPNATACALARQGAQAGSASALMGSMQFGVAALASSMVGALHDGSAMPMSLVIMVCGVTAAILAWFSGQLEVHPSKAGPASR